MTEQDFAYWLQGFFELLYAEESLELAALTTKRVNIINNHIKLVRTLEGNSPLTDTVYEILQTKISLTQQEKLIRNVLATIFKHVIDPQHPNQDAANDAHGGYLSNNYLDNTLFGAKV